VKIVEVCCNVRFARSSIHTVHDNADRITESVKSGTEVCVQQDHPSPTGMNELYQKLWMCNSYIFIALEINTYIAQKCLCVCIYIYICIYTVQVHMSTSGIVIHYTD
jgi:hypothetical protein